MLWDEHQDFSGYFTFGSFWTKVCTLQEVSLKMELDSSTH